jgi:hypothetical protein
MMHVLEFFDGLIVVPHVDVIIATLPEPSISRHLEFSRHLLFQNLQDGGGWEIASFADQQRNMLGHDDLSGGDEGMALPELLPLLLEDAVSGPCGEPEPSLVTTEGYNVEVARVLIAD